MIITLGKHGGFESSGFLSAYFNWVKTQDLGFCQERNDAWDRYIDERDGLYPNTSKYIGSFSGLVEIGGDSITINGDKLMLVELDTDPRFKSKCLRKYGSVLIGALSALYNLKGETS